MTQIKTCIAAILLASTLLWASVQVLATSSTNTSISLEIKAGLLCKLNLIVYPEKRIPRTENWDTQLIIYIYKDAQKIASATASSNNLGEATFDFCPQNLTFEAGNYDIAIKGLSHLCKYFQGIRAFENDSQVINLTLNNQVLLAGETSNIFDDKINSLDASTQIRAFYKTNDEKNDLNQDGKVNSLDFSNTVYNFYRLGDGMCR
jgi:hypothetical protein